jgi:hypothetical protein
VNTLFDRFEKYYTPTEGCWIWFGAKNRKGYGQLGITVGSKKTTARAHRIAYEKYIGSIPKGVLVLHKCDVPACVNPEHLFLGTDKDNAIDRNAKKRNRSNKGENNHTCKTSIHTVTTIKQMLKAGFSRKELVEFFHKTKNIVDCIATGKSWQHVI